MLYRVVVVAVGCTDLSSMLSDLTVSDRRAPGCEKKSLEMAVHQNFAPFDYEQKKMLVAKVIQSKPSFNDYRVPTSTWSGYGLSQSIPPISTTDLNKVSGSTRRISASTEEQVANVTMNFRVVCRS